METFPPCSRDTLPVAPSPLTKTEPLPINFCCSIADFEKISQGAYVDGVWGMFVENDTLYMVRSRTGFTVYEIPFVRENDVVKPANAVVNRDPQQYKEDDIAYDAALAAFIIAVIMLQRDEAFPLHERVAKSNPPPKVVLMIQGRSAGTCVEKYYSWPKK
ncbi:hypothetical protein J8273_2218 [Carpediemonas membranifera]|uniref:Uncharacterized protein n=1 Tax=Carpediemonas membranifera TaxID=201153 RepID=A0A8J6AZ51_9EUKA|nr:hypothetical protein J8273_2218 [Carpediemonas membranifera]|eukprot:KAG9395885.1 hypothetical protein J8273_2218 [Carpediemonas membranifera]